MLVLSHLKIQKKRNKKIYLYALYNFFRDVTLFASSEIEKKNSFGEF